MQKSPRVVFLVITVVALILAACAGQPTSQPLAPTPQTWEYLSLAVTCHMIPPNEYRCTEVEDGWDETAFKDMKSLGEYMNAYGQEGWELVSMYLQPEDFLMPQTTILAFKRPVLNP